MLACAAYAAENMAPQKTLTYKKVGKVELTLDVFNPEPHASIDKRPAIILFFMELLTKLCHLRTWNASQNS